MLTLESLNSDKPLSVYLAIEFAEKALPIWEREYPKDMRPRKAIEAAKEWLKNPADAAADAAAYAAANAAANAANAAARAAARAAYAAADAYAAANAAYAVRAAAANAANASTYAAAANAANASAYAAAYAANASAYAAFETDKENLIHEVILENLDYILQYKIEKGQSFAQPELILGYLDEEQKQSFLFNLDAVA